MLSDVALKHSEYIEYSGEVLVTLGCIGEFIAEFTPLLPKERNHQCSRSSLLVLIIGLVVSLAGMYKTNALSGNEIAALNSKLADRTFNLDADEQVRLSKFAKQRFEILTYADDREARSLADNIAKTLGKLGWLHMGTAAGGVDQTAPLNIGTTVEISRATGNDTDKAATMLGSIFVTQHISEAQSARVTFPQDANGRPPDIIRITVGRKP